MLLSNEHRKKFYDDLDNSDTLVDYFGVIGADE